MDETRGFCPAFLPNTTISSAHLRTPSCGCRLLTVLCCTLRCRLTAFVAIVDDRRPFGDVHFLVVVLRWSCHRGSWKWLNRTWDRSWDRFPFWCCIDHGSDPVGEENLACVMARFLVWCGTSTFHADVLSSCTCPLGWLTAL